MLQIQNLLKRMRAEGASDLFLRSGTPPSLRVDGAVRTLEEPALPSDKVRSIAHELMHEGQLARFNATQEMDLSIQVEDAGRFRVNVYCERGNVGLVLRYVPPPGLGFEELNLPPAVQMLASRRRGLALVTGTTGSGKSTTLAAMVNYINQTRQCHIVTIEDPIEFVHADSAAIVSQREVGLDTQTFSAALRHVLRQDPDVIMIGEMRDLETIQTAIASAETGHLVLSTLHTTDAVQPVERIINYFPNHLQQQIRLELALTLQGVVSMRLLPMVQGRGRVPATEVLIATAIIKKLIHEGNTTELRGYIADGVQFGMMTFDQSLLRLYQEKKIDLAEALAHANSPDEFRQAASGITTGTKAHGLGGLA